MRQARTGKKRAILRPYRSHKYPAKKGIRAEPKISPIENGIATAIAAICGGTLSVVNADKLMGATPPTANPAIEIEIAKSKKLEPDKIKPKKPNPVTNTDGISTGLRPT